MTRLIISDIDGTLLPQGKTEVPGRVLRALQGAIDQGMHVVIASGRLYSDIPRELRELRGLRYVITCNGASIFDQETGNIIYTKRIPEGRAADILRELRSYPCYGCAYLSDGVHNWSVLPEGLDELYPLRGEFFRERQQEDLAAWLEENGQGVDKIFVAVLDPEQRHMIRRELSKTQGVHVTSSSAKNLEINHIEADKGTALAWLCRYLDISSGDVIAMGDNENDYNMLTLAGTSVVPSNGVEVIRDLASVIVPDVRQCGMAQYLETQVLKKQ